MSRPATFFAVVVVAAALPESLSESPHEAATRLTMARGTRSHMVRRGFDKVLPPELGWFTQATIRTAGGHRAGTR